MSKTLFHPTSSEIATRMDDMLAKITAKDRAGVEKHLAICDAQHDPAHGTTWRRLAGLLGGLVSLPARGCGGHALAFFIPDGKYRKQVFSLEDPRDGRIIVYLPDVASHAVQTELLEKRDECYTLPGSDEPYATIIGGDLPEPRNHVKPMLGWNRKAIKISISTTFADGRQIRTAELLCCLAAESWAGPEQ